MSGIMIIIALLVGLGLVAAVWAYGKLTERGPGKVKPDAQPTPEEEHRPDPPAGSS